jgi:exodeoxyribonuclease V alpha subunit
METQQTTTPAGPDVVQLEGSLDRVRVNGRDGWIVGTLYDSKKGERYTITGTLPEGLRPGDHLRLTGAWVMTEKFGKQFNFSTAAPVTPTGADGVKKWLVRYIDGIGEKAAEFLIDHLGVDGATKVLEERTSTENDPLVEIAGFTPERAAKARQSYAALGAYPEQKLWLAKNDIVGALAGRVVKKYKEETRTVLEADPYKPMLDVDGFGFLRCDEFAKKLGVLDHDPRRARAAIVQSFADQAMEGHVFLLEEQLLAALAKDYMVPVVATRDALAAVIHEGLVVVEGKAEPRLYLAGMRDCERSLAFDILRVIDAGKLLEPLVAPLDPQLNEEQQSALELAGKVACLGLTGGPGTGKSHTLRAILRLLDPDNEKTLLAAPTGKAAKRMSQATGRPASTIHRALEFGPGANLAYGFKRNRSCKLWQRVIVIDEASMVDTALAAALFAAIPDGARVVIVGDVDQLPSVGPGTVLKDLLDCELHPRRAPGSATCAARRAARSPPRPRK